MTWHQNVVSGSAKSCRLRQKKVLQYWSLYSGCKYEKPDPAKRVTKLRSLRNYIVFDETEQVVKAHHRLSQKRYAFYIINYVKSVYYVDHFYDCLH